ncbi:Ion_transport 2 and transmembrane domain-containing protein [Hexamita inflata]|uniref:Ion transport 2 and transmembrane domain-containing protein n=1 Tax=Hexamita inflata TaxID=28002 RepID=A0AA86NF77_9EUKA|nr:Ion transport 2 and transmembrane domain-containing protein [Hexamita inflata]
MFFAGCFQWLLDETLTIFYFIVVTLSTVGYGDISFRSTSGGMILSIAFVITALVYVPIEISAIMQRVQVELHQIQVKKFIADGIVIIAKYDKALASMMRLKIPKNINITYIVIGQTKPIEKPAFCSSPSMMYTYLQEFTQNKGDEWCIQRAKKIIVVSQQYSGLSDAECIMITKTLNDLNKDQIETNLIINTEHYYNIAQAAFKRFAKVYVFCFENFLSRLLVNQLTNKGFSTFFYNIMCNDDEKLELNYWPNNKSTKEQEQSKQLYNNSIKWNLSSCRSLQSINKPLGIDFFMSQYTQDEVIINKTEERNQILDQKEDLKIPQIQIAKIAIVVYEKAPAIILNDLIHHLTGFNLTIFQMEDTILENSQIKVINFSEDDLSKLDQLIEYQSVLIMHPAIDEYSSSTVFTLDKYIEYLNLQTTTLSDLYPDDYHDEQQVHIQFRNGTRVPFPKAYFTAVMCNNFKQMNIGEFFLKEIENKNTFLTTYKINNKIEIGKIGNKEMPLYMGYQQNIINSPDIQWELNTNDWICMVSWLDPDQVLDVIQEPKQQTEEKLTSSVIVKSAITSTKEFKSSRPASRIIKQHQKQGERINLLVAMNPTYTEPEIISKEPKRDSVFSPTKNRDWRNQ